MGIHAKLWSLRASLVIGLIFSSSPLFSQLIAIDSLLFKEDITAFSQDRTGNIFLTFKGGSITKYSPNLDSIISYSPSKVGDIKLLEAWHGFQIFAFYEEFQEIMLLDRFLTRDTRYSISNSASVYADICSISSDQNLWVFEENQLRLLKVNLNIREIDIEAPLEFIIDSKDHSITFIREYQNLLFLIDEISGIYIFDNLGNYLRRIDAPGIQQCSFYSDNIYYIINNQVQSINLYKGLREEMTLPQDSYLGVIPVRDALLVVKKGSLIKYPLQFD